MSPTKGTDLLAVEPAAGPFARPPRLSGRLRRRGTLAADRWVVDVRYARHGGVLRLVCDSPVSFEPGESCRLDGEPIHLLVALDALDPSSRRRAARLIADTGWNDPNELARRIAGSPAGSRSVRDYSSPAARALLEELRRLEHDDPRELHTAAMEASGRAPIVGELVDRGEILKLDGGYLVERATYESRARALPPSFSSREAAERWGCSHGRARAILGRMADEGRVHRRGGTFARAEADDA